MKGAIIGDIVGSIYEFHNIKTKDFPLLSPNCFFTDDTVMTVAVAAALETAGVDAPDAVISRWMLKMMRGYGRTYPDRGYGGMFRRWLEERHPRPYYSSGNGSAMRVSPVAWFARSLEECEKLARLSAEITHNHPDGICGAQATGTTTGTSAWMRSDRSTRLTISLPSMKGRFRMRWRPSSRVRASRMLFGTLSPSGETVTPLLRSPVPLQRRTTVFRTSFGNRLSPIWK